MSSFRNARSIPENYFSPEESSRLKQNQFARQRVAPSGTRQPRFFFAMKGAQPPGHHHVGPVHDDRDKKRRLSGLGLSAHQLCSGGSAVFQTIEFRSGSLQVRSGMWRNLYPAANTTPSVYTPSCGQANDDEPDRYPLDCHQSDKSQYFTRDS